MNREILSSNGYDFYEKNDSAQELADKTLSAFFGRKVKISDLPINPFAIMVSAGAYYVILDFSSIEGFFMPPKNGEKYSKIGLSLKALPERRRFSAAHELCHHLKDTDMRITKQGFNDDLEVFANKFATSLLMPDQIVNEVIEELEISKVDVNLDKVLKFSIKFAVSFQSAFIVLNKKLKWGLSSKDIAKESKKYKPQKMRENLTKDTDYLYSLYKEIIENYKFIKFKTPTKTKNDFLKFVVTNDHLIENGKLGKKRISEIVSLLRIKTPSELREKIKLSDAECEVVGQYLMYEHIFNNAYTSDMNELKNLHQKFCTLACFPEYGGHFRDTVAYIKGTNVAPVEPRLIEIELIELFNRNWMELDDNIKIIKEILLIHHGITVIHPFNDGNGRTSRALMNYQLISKNISPFFISYETSQKKEYYEGLQICDNTNKLHHLELYVYKNIIEMYSKLIGKSTSDQ